MPRFLPRPGQKTGSMASDDNRGQKMYLLASPQYASVPDPRQNVENNRGGKPFLHWCYKEQIKRSNLLNQSLSVKWFTFFKLVSNSYVSKIFYFFITKVDNNLSLLLLFSFKLFISVHKHSPLFKGSQRKIVERIFFFFIC